MPRKRKPAEVIEQLPEAHLTVAAPTESFAAKVRPTEPRKRAPGEPFNVLSSTDARLDRAGDYYEVTLAEKPSAELYAQAQKWGLDDMTEHDTGEQWAGHRKELIKHGTDPNYVAMVLAGKAEDRGR